MSSKAPAPAAEAAVILPSASESWMEKNLKPLVAFAFILIAVLTALGVVRYRTDAVAREAGGAFTAADSVEALDAVIAKYPGSQAAANSLLAKAELLWEKNQKDSSTAALKKFLETNSKHPLVAQTKLALASRLEGMGEKAEARTLYEELVAQYADSEVTPLAAIRLGDLLWAEGKTDEAKAIYESLPSKYPGTNQPFFDQSQERLKWVGAALPTKEVDPPAPPPAAPAAPGAATPAPAGAGVPAIQLGGTSGGATTPMKVTVAPNGAVTTPAVEVKPSPANPETVKPLAPKPVEAPKTELPAPGAAPAAPKLEVPAPAPTAPAKPE
jgi:predicted negative regulator of RcsB-dependent stress response